jgi:transcriptional regulator with XRE-family HTH domain
MIAELLSELVMIRWRSGLTQQDVADHMGTPRTDVCRFENSAHKGRSPRLSTLMRYAAAVGAEIHATTTRTAR